MVIKNRNHVGKVRDHHYGPSTLAFHRDECLFFKKQYEFECPENRTAGIFLRVLHGFHIEPQDVTVSEKNLDYSLIIFWADRKTRLRIEYVLREFLGLKPIYLMEVDWTESSLDLTCNDGYVIF